jgi:hypothetical protein
MWRRVDDKWLGSSPHRDSFRIVFQDSNLQIFQVERNLTGKTAAGASGTASERDDRGMLLAVCEKRNGSCIPAIADR